MAEYRKGGHSAHDIKYHLVWVTTYRYPIPAGDVGVAARDLIRRACMERDALIIKGHVSRDHVHLLVSTPPNVAPSDLVQAVKGKSARLLFQEFPSLRRRYWGQRLWARSYFCSSAGTVTDEMIRVSTTFSRPGYPLTPALSPCRGRGGPCAADSLDAKRVDAWIVQKLSCTVGHGHNRPGREGFMESRVRTSRSDGGDSAAFRLSATLSVRAMP